MTSLTIQDIAQKMSELSGGGIKPSSGSYMVRCPAHADGRPSLNISRGDSQPVVLYCHAGCEPDAIMEAAGLSWSDVSNDQAPATTKVQGEWTPDGEAVAVYDYRDEKGDLLSQVLRTAEKKFFQRHPDPSRKTGWAWTMQGVRRVLYRLPEVIECAAAGAEIWIAEGEKDADALVAHGLCGTCSIGGAGKWRDEYAKVLTDAVVTIVADNDDPGQAHARTVRESLIANGVMRVRVVEAAAGKDASDHFAAGKTVEEFRVTIPYEDRPKPKLAMDLDEYLAQQLPPQKFVIEGTLARGEIMLLTGYEGFGKSTFCKQVAVECAFGVHPFTGASMEPSTVLFIDAENKTPDNYADFMRLRWIANHHTTGERKPLYIIESGPIDVSKEEWALWLIERVRAHGPDLLIIGPIYNIIGRDVKHEDDARALKLAIDAAQAVNGCAVLMETHVPHGDKDGRDLRPIGSSLLLRWPSFGFGLAPIERPDKKPTGVSEWKAWRGARRRNRHWPEALRVGNGGVEWMWEACSPEDLEQARMGSR